MIDDVIDSKSVALTVHVFLVIIPFIVPVVPIVLSCVISVYAMTKSIDVSTEMSATNLNHQVILEKKKVTLAVVMVTLVYIIFNVPPVITLILYSVGYVNPNAWKLFSFDRYAYYNNFLEIYCVGLNAMVNPLIYMILMPALKKHLLEICKYFRSFKTSCSQR